MSGGKKYTDVAWRDTKEEKKASYALVIQRAAKSWNQVELQVVISGGVYYGQNDVGDMRSGTNK